MYQDYLAHFGVKGMKWGVRKEKDKKNRKKKLSEMSNKELQEEVNRKNLERQYKQLNKKKLKIAAVVGGTILAPAMIEVAKNTTRKYMQHGVDDIIKRGTEAYKAAKLGKEFLESFANSWNKKWN